jgi:pimeloyl-ACP methyl ester carboxylesterase
VNEALPKRRIAISAGEIASIDIGAGAPVVLLHGFHNSSFLWRRLIPSLSPSFRLIAPDLIACGDSDRAADHPIGTRAHVTYLRELFDALELESFAIVAHGHGGGLAQLLALEHPGVRALVLLDSVAFDAWPAYGFRQLVQTPEPQRTEQLIRAVISTTLELGMKRVTPTAELRSEYERPFAGEEGVATYFRWAETALDEQQILPGTELGRLEIPAFLLWGEEDPFYSVELAERLAEAIPISSLGLLPGCSHYITEEAPDTIGPMIHEWLRAKYLGMGHAHAADDRPIVVSLGRRPPPEAEFFGDEGEE